MKILEPKFEKWGATFTQIKRVGDIALFQAQRNRSGARWWEVAIIQRHNGYNIGGKELPPSETYPGDEAMGRQGWACVSLDRAEEKFEEIRKTHQNKATSTPYIPRGDGTKGRKPILKPCVCCAKPIYTSVFARGKGKCPECFSKVI